MYVVPPYPAEGDLVRIGRRAPPDHWMSREGYHSIPENRQWDGDQREWISKGIGLHSVASSAWSLGSDRWWKRTVEEYVRTELLVAIGHGADLEGPV